MLNIYRDGKKTDENRLNMIAARYQKM